MTTSRRLWTTLLLGSHLYGTAVEGSDTDLLELYLPTPVELVENRRYTLSQCIKDGIDTRGALLGDFVMSLGINVEHSTLAYHYSDLFGELQPYWLNGQAIRNILDAATNMWVNGKTPKNKAHAYRYAYCAMRMCQGLELYPMVDQAHVEYMALRNDETNQRTTESFLGALAVIRDAADVIDWADTDADRYRAREKRAEWVLLRYLNLA